MDNNDLTQWRANFGLATGATHMQGNADFDGDVDGGDFLIWQQQRGSGPLARGKCARPCLSLGVLSLAALAWLGVASRRARR